MDKRNPAKKVIPPSSPVATAERSKKMPAMIGTKEKFDELIASKPMVVVDFTASWCGPCQFIAPKFAEMDNENPYIEFIKVDVDENDETAAACGISCMPTFQFYKNGEKVDELQGASEDQLRAKIAALKK